jgi:hypothetical protein
MERGVKGRLEIDTLAQAIGGHEHAAFLRGQLGNLGAAFVVAQHAGNGRNADVRELALQGPLQPRGNVIGGGDITAPDDGMKAFANQLGH